MVWFLASSITLPVICFSSLCLMVNVPLKELLCTSVDPLEVWESWFFSCSSDLHDLFLYKDIGPGTNMSLMSLCINVLYMPVLCISEKHPQNFICIVLKFHKTPHSEDNCKSMLSIIDDSSTTAFLKNRKELSTPNSQLHIETSLTGSDSTVTTMISITVPSPSHTHARWIPLYAFSLF